MTSEQIETLAAAGESETLELKRSTGQRTEGAQTVCAMLNHRGGYVLFGIEPDGRVVGQQVSDRTIEEVTQELREIEPPACPYIERVGLSNGQEVIEVRAALPVAATERQIREDLAILRTLNLAIPFGHGRGARWSRL